MDSKPLIILNCRSQKTLHPGLINSLKNQNVDYEVSTIESENSPSRLSQISDQQKLYFFFDEDVELPSMDYLKNIIALFKKNPELLVLGGKYLPHTDQSYLAKSYNSQIEFWLSKKSSSQELGYCQNLPGGVWIISGKIKPFLKNWKEPESWAGEDTFSMRWLQSQGIVLYHHRLADVVHYPRSQFFYFCRRAYLQGRARTKLGLRSDYTTMNWNLLWKNTAYWPGWALHQFFVEVGSLSFKAKKTPTISPTA